MPVRDWLPPQCALRSSARNAPAKACRSRAGGRAKASARPRAARFQDRRGRAIRPLTLLPNGARGLRRSRLEIAAEGIDVDAAPAQETGIDREVERRASAQDVDEYPLHAAFVEGRVATIRNQVLQQARAVDARAAIADHHVGVIRLRR